MRKSNRQIRQPLPVENVEVSHKNVGLRLVFFWLFVAIAIAGIAVGVYFLARVEKGWQMVSPRSSAKANCSSDFSFYYYFDGTGSNNRSTYRALENKYTELTVTLYEDFADVPITDVKNVYYLNHHTNEIVDVAPYLYSSLKKAAESRYIFGAPIEAFYESLCASQGDWEAVDYDPARNDVLKAECLEILAYARDKNHISIEFFEDSKLRLNVSQEYLDFAEEHNVHSFIDFAYMKNAFIIDRMAKELVDLGFTNGLITSYDGYTRTLSSQECTFDLFSSIEKKEYYVGMAQLGGNYASVNLHAFGTNNRDVKLHYKYDDGAYAHCYFDMEDSISKCSADGLLVYSENKNCSDLLLSVLPIWISDNLDTAALSAGVAGGTEYAYVIGTKVHYSDAKLSVTVRPSTEELVFEAIKD